MSDLVGELQSAGFPEASAVRKAELLGNCIRALGGKRPAYVIFVPGRVEVMGKHTDYAGGRSITCAIDRGIVAAVMPRSDSHCLFHACDIRQSLGFELTPSLAPPPVGWGNYVMSVARRVSRNFGPPILGADVAFASDLPQAGGMSSSSALVVATYLSINAANHFEHRSVYRENIRNVEDLAGYLGTCENGQSFGSLAGDRGVGTFGGSEDHTAILCSQAGHLSVYSYNPVRLERRILFPCELALVIGVSGVVAEKTGVARDRYNRISQLMSAIMEVLRAEGWNKPSLAAAINDDPHATECAGRILAASRHPLYKPTELLRRFEQFVVEHQRLTPAVADALEQRDWEGLGIAVDSSQRMADAGLGNQVPETIALARMARQLGAKAASAFGAGFGGSVWAMVNRYSAERFVSQWRDRYLAAFPHRADIAEFFITCPVSGAVVI